MTIINTLAKFSVRGALLAFFLLLANIASAHTGLKESTPAADSVVKATPSEITLVFSGPVRLVKVELLMGDKTVPTGFEPAADATANYVIETPVLSPGSFTVNWAAIGGDGHTVSNSFGFKFDPQSSAP